MRTRLGLIVLSIALAGLITVAYAAGPTAEECPEPGSGVPDRRADRRQARTEAMLTGATPSMACGCQGLRRAAVFESMRIYQVDSFTTKPFSGNPAGVVIADRELPSAWMQLVAAEMNLAETAFAVRESAASFHLRWFTPTVEVDLCGHATLAAAHVLWEEEVVPSGTELVFRTLSGELRAAGGAGSVELDFPSEAPALGTAPEGMLESLGIKNPVYVGRNRMDYVIEIEHEADVRGLRPDMSALAKFETRGVIVTARSSAPEIDFVSRFFGPAVGVPEDPVTGSAHCALAPYWGNKLNKQQMRGSQVSTRGGTVGVRVAGARVILIGDAVTVIRGEIADPRVGSTVVRPQSIRR